MSFHVVLYRPAGSRPLEASEAERAILGLPNTRRTASDVREYRCDDPGSGQSYRLVLSHDTAASHGVSASGPTLDFSVDYSVPDAVMERAMSTVFHVAGLLALRVRNAQERMETADPDTADDLVRSFVSRRQAAVDAARGNRMAIGLVKVSREKMEYRHSYLQRRSAIEDAHIDLGLHVPDQVFLVRPVSGDSGLLVVRWPDCIPMVFPDVDYVIIERERRGLFGFTVGRDIGFAPFSHIIRLLGPDLQRVEQPVLHFVYRRPEPRPELAKAIDRLDLISLNSFAEPEPEDVVEV